MPHAVAIDCERMQKSTLCAAGARVEQSCTLKTSGTAGPRAGTGCYVCHPVLEGLGERKF